MHGARSNLSLKEILTCSHKGSLASFSWKYPAINRQGDWKRTRAPGTNPANGLPKACAMPARMNQTSEVAFRGSISRLSSGNARTSAGRAEKDPRRNRMLCRSDKPPKPGLRKKPHEPRSEIRQRARVKFIYAFLFSRSQPLRTGSWHSRSWTVWGIHLVFASQAQGRGTRSAPNCLPVQARRDSGHACARVTSVPAVPVEGFRV